MAGDKKVDNSKIIQALEEEFKLMKGELKETLSSVRDYVLNSELPASEYAKIMEALGVGGPQQSLMGKFSLDKTPEAEEIQEEIIEEPLPEEPYSEQAEQDEPEALEEEEPAEPDEPVGQGPEPLEPQMEYRQVREEVNQSVPRVNLLTNLHHWVSNAKREIGIEQLPVFLEVYGTTGYLSPELKEVILYMADLTSQRSTEASASEIWSKLMLELHGIMTGGDAPLHPVKPFWNDSGNDNEEEISPIEAEVEVEEEKPEEKPKEKPLKLRLVITQGEAEEKREYCLDLNPDEDEDSP